MGKSLFDAMQSQLPSLKAFATSDTCSLSQANRRERISWKPFVKTPQSKALYGESCISCISLAEPTTQHSTGWVTGRYLFSLTSSSHFSQMSNPHRKLMNAMYVWSTWHTPCKWETSLLSCLTQVKGCLFGSRLCYIPTHIMAEYCITNASSWCLLTTLLQ